MQGHAIFMPQGNSMPGVIVFVKYKQKSSQGDRLCVHGDTMAA